MAWHDPKPKYLSGIIALATLRTFLGTCAVDTGSPKKPFPFPKEEQESMEREDQSQGGQTYCHPVSAGSRSFSGFCPAMGPEFCQKIPSALAQGPYIVLLKSPPGRKPVAWRTACSLSGQIPTLALSPCGDSDQATHLPQDGTRRP